jgi:hypothetical protein
MLGVVVSLSGSFPLGVSTLLQEEINKEDDAINKSQNFFIKQK